MVCLPLNEAQTVFELYNYNGFFALFHADDGILKYLLGYIFFILMFF